MDEELIYTLFLKYKADCLTNDERNALKAWLDESEEHRKRFVTFLRTYKQEMQHRMLDQLDTQKAWDIHIYQRRFRLWRRRIVGWTSAAAVAALCCWAGYVHWVDTPTHTEATLTELFPNHGQRQAQFVSCNEQVCIQADSIFTWITPPNTDQQKSEYQWNKYSSRTHSVRLNEVHVPRGGEYSLTLDDGTRVWLNAHSTLSFSYPFDSCRVVRLEGEAYFEVTHDKKPFRVYAGDNEVTVLGTKFNVRAYEGEQFRVTLAEGAVQVSGNAGKQLLQPNEQLSLENSAYIIHPTNAHAVTAWTRGEFEFDNTPLEEIVHQLERWYNVDMTFASSDLHSIRFTGTILRKESLGYALEMIQKISDVRFSKQDNRVFIERK